MSQPQSDLAVQERRKVHCSECCRDFYSNSNSAFLHYCPNCKRDITLKPAEGFDSNGNRVATPKQLAERMGVTGRMSEADLDILAAAASKERQRCLDAVRAVTARLMELGDLWVDKAELLQYEKAILEA